MTFQEISFFLQNLHSKCFPRPLDSCFRTPRRKANDSQQVVQSTLLHFLSVWWPSAFASRSAFCFCLRRKNVLLLFILFTFSTAIASSRKSATREKNQLFLHACEAWQTFEKPLGTECHIDNQFRFFHKVHKLCHVKRKESALHPTLLLPKKEVPQVCCLKSFC